MTNFIKRDPAELNSARKKRQQATPALDTAATQRAVATLQRAMGRQIQKSDKEERLRAKAIADTMPDLIAAMDEEALPAFFFALERLATAPNRRRIASHPLRPAHVDDLHEEADEEAMRTATEEKAAGPGSTPASDEASPGA